uniref:Uncharacterized protein n=1 Tax=Octopus bimaculoides TaxID=37653 RepID=A0A0L8G4B2_OCTBM
MFTENHFNCNSAQDNPPTSKNFLKNKKEIKDKIIKVSEKYFEKFYLKIVIKQN